MQHLKDLSLHQSLADSINTRQHEALLQKARSLCPVMQGCISWSAVADLWNSRSLSWSERDALLHMLLSLTRGDQARGNAILLFVLWRWLRRLEARYYARRDELDDRRQELVLSFFLTVRRLAARGVQQYLTRRLNLDIRDRMRVAYQREGRTATRRPGVVSIHTPANVNRLSPEVEVVAARPDERLRRVDDRDAVATLLGEVRRVFATLLTDRDVELVVRTRYEGEPLKVVAADLWLTPSAATNRHYRAERRLLDAGYELPNRVSRQGPGYEQAA